MAEGAEFPYYSGLTLSNRESREITKSQKVLTWRKTILVSSLSFPQLHPFYGEDGILLNPIMESFIMRFDNLRAFPGNFSN